MSSYVSATLSATLAPQDRDEIMIAIAPICAQFPFILA